jgi:hypothetical protein
VRVLRCACAGLISAQLACATVNHGLPPLRPADPSPQASCLYDGTLTLVPGSSSLQVVDDSGVRFSPSYVSAVPLVTMSGSQTSHSSGASGFTLYLGEVRLKPREGLERLSEPRLVERYDRDVDRFASGRYHRWARPAWITLLVGAMGMIGGGLAITLSAKADPVTGKTDFGAGIPLLLGSIGALLGSIPFLAFDLLNRDAEGQLAAREELLVPDPSMEKAVGEAVSRHNEAAAARCGASRSP